MRLVGPKLLHKLSTPNAKKVIKAGEITLIEGGKVAAAVLGHFNYQDVKGYGDFGELALRWTIGTCRKNRTVEKFEKTVYGNPANIFTDSVMYIINGGKKSKEIIKSLFK